MPDIISLQVTSLRPTPIEPAGGTAVVTVQSGDTVYYADAVQVSATHNQGSLTVGQSVPFTGLTFLRSAGLSQVQAQLTPSASSGGSGSFVTAMSGSGSASTISLLPGTQIWYTITLTADHVSTITPIGGGMVKYFVKQDGTGGHTFSISDGVTVEPAHVPTQAGACGLVVITACDSTDLWME